MIVANGPGGMILHVLNSSKVGGVEGAILRNIAELGERVATVFLLEDRCPGGTAGRDFAAALGLPVCEIQVRSRLDRQAVRELAQVFTRLSPRIVHAHDVKASTYALLAAKLARLDAALFSTHHGIHGRPDGKTRFYERFYTKVVLPRYDRVLAVSLADGEELAETLGPQVRVHLNGIDGRRVAPDDRARVRAGIRAAWPALPEGAAILGVVARLSPEKGHGRVLDVCAALRQRHPALRWHLVCFGAGPLADSLAQQTAALALEDHVTWAGCRPMLGDELAALDVLLSMSIAEGLPLNVIEAGWAGTPVIATAVGGTTDLLGDPPAGVLVPPWEANEAIADRLAALLYDPSHASALGKALQARVASSFSGAVWRARLLELYRPFLAGGSRSGRPVP
jgi:glycosyltransferase involved in cell wall biosynthesis